MRILAVDPGTTHSAMVVYDTEGDVHVPWREISPNENIILLLGNKHFAPGALVVFEQIESFGMAVGRETFETVHWSGRMFERAWTVRDQPARLPRKTVKLHLCGSMRAKDANIRQALIDKFGGKEKALDRQVGPLWGLKSHMWSALAVAVTFAETKR